MRVSRTIPTEIYDLVFSHFDQIPSFYSFPIFKNLSLVCKLWCALAQRRLFKNLKISNQKSTTTPPGVGAFFSAHPHLSPHVRNLVVALDQRYQDNIYKITMAGRENELKKSVIQQQCNGCYDSDMAEESENLECICHLKPTVSDESDRLIRLYNDSSLPNVLSMFSKLKSLHMINMTSAKWVNYPLPLRRAVINILRLESFVELELNHVRKVPLSLLCLSPSQSRLKLEMTTFKPINLRHTLPTKPQPLASLKLTLKPDEFHAVGLFFDNPHFSTMIAGVEDLRLECYIPPVEKGRTSSWDKFPNVIDFSKFPNLKHLKWRQSRVNTSWDEPILWVANSLKRLKVDHLTLVLDTRNSIEHASSPSTSEIWANLDNVLIGVGKRSRVDVSLIVRWSLGGSSVGADAFQLRLWQVHQKGWMTVVAK